MFCDLCFVLPTDFGQGNKEQLLNPMTIDSWLLSYGLKSRLRIAPEQVDVVLTNESVSSCF